MLLAGNPVAGFGVFRSFPGQGAVATTPGQLVASPPDVVFAGGYQVGPFVLPTLPYEDYDPGTGAPTAGSTFEDGTLDAIAACSTNQPAGSVAFKGSGLVMTITDPSQISQALRDQIAKVIFDPELLHPALVDRGKNSFGNYWFNDSMGTVDPWWKDRGRFSNEPGYDMSKPAWWNQPKLQQSYRDWITALGIGPDENYNLSMISVAASGVEPWNTYGPIMGGIPVAQYRGPILEIPDAPGVPRGATAADRGLSIWDPTIWTPTDNPDAWDANDPNRPWMPWSIFLQLRAWGNKYDYEKVGGGCNSKCTPVPYTPVDSYFVLDVYFVPTRNWTNFGKNSGCFDPFALLPKLLLGEISWVFGELTQLVCDILTNPAALAALAVTTAAQTAPPSQKGKPTQPQVAAASAQLLAQAAKQCTITCPDGTTKAATQAQCPTLLPVPTIGATGIPWSVVIVGALALAAALLLSSPRPKEAT